MTDSLDEIDRKLLMMLQNDAGLSFERIAQNIGLSKTAVWNRVQKLTQNKTIIAQSAILDPEKIGLSETFFVQIRTNAHDDDWLRKFYDAVQEFPEITEAHRLAGSIDYILKVQVRSTREFDDFYKRLVTKISINDVSSLLSMETLKKSYIYELE